MLICKVLFVDGYFFDIVVWLILIIFLMGFYEVLLFLLIVF